MIYIKTDEKLGPSDFYKVEEVEKSGKTEIILSLRVVEL
jgi:hypothetical protein